MKGSTFFFSFLIVRAAQSTARAEAWGYPHPPLPGSALSRHDTRPCGAVRPCGRAAGRAPRGAFSEANRKGARGKPASRARNSGDRPSIAPGEAMARSVCGRTPWPPSSSPGRQQREQRARAQISRAPARAPRAPRARAAWRSRRVWPLAGAADAQGASPAELLRGGDLYAVLDVQEGPNASAAELKVHISPC